MASLGTPAFRLYLLRHARAAWAEPGKTDFDRTLDDDGFAEAEVVAEEATDQGYKPALIISSTAVRCRQTAEPFHRSVSEELTIDYVDSLYSGTVDTYAELAFADRQETSVMIVGHNPMIEEFFHRLVGKGDILGKRKRLPTLGTKHVHLMARPLNEQRHPAMLAAHRRLDLTGTGKRTPHSIPPKSLWPIRHGPIRQAAWRTPCPY